MPRCHVHIAVTITLNLAFVVGLCAADDGKVRCYTNDDLERVSALRGQTGVLSESATEAPSDSESKRFEKERRAEEKARHKAEQFWRKAARRHRDQIQRLEDRIVSIEQRKEREQERRKAEMRKGRLPDRVSPAFDEEIERVRERIRELESDFLDRARRDGALPGWLR